MTEILVCVSRPINLTQELIAYSVFVKHSRTETSRAEEIMANRSRQKFISVQENKRQLQKEIVNNLY
jgi:hypothetical protein